VSKHENFQNELFTSAKEMLLGGSKSIDFKKNLFNSTNLTMSFWEKVCMRMLSLRMHTFFGKLQLYKYLFLNVDAWKEIKNLF